MLLDYIHIQLEYKYLMMKRKKYKPVEESERKIEISKIELKFLNSTVTFDNIKIIIGIKFFLPD